MGESGKGSPGPVMGVENTGSAFRKGIVVENCRSSSSGRRDTVARRHLVQNMMNVVVGDGRWWVTRLAVLEKFWRCEVSGQSGHR